MSILAATTQGGEFRSHFLTIAAMNSIVEEAETERASVLRIWNVRPEDPTPQQRMRLLDSCGTFDFWNDPREDVYSESDGEAI